MRIKKCRICHKEYEWTKSTAYMKPYYCSRECEKTHMCRITNCPDSRSLQEEVEQDIQDIIIAAHKEQERIRKNGDIINQCTEIIDTIIYPKALITDPPSISIYELMRLIVDYRENNCLDTHDTLQNLIKAISVESGELLEICAFNDGEKLNEDEVADELADVLIYSIELSRRISKPIDKIIAKKIIKNIERDRKYDN